jgi:hypothetical protein
MSKSSYDQNCCGCAGDPHVPAGEVCRLGHDQCGVDPDDFSKCRHCGQPRDLHGKTIRPEPPCPHCGARDEWDFRAGTIRVHAKTCPNR